MVDYGLRVWQRVFPITIIYIIHYIHYPLFLPRLLLQHFLFHLVIPQNEAAARGDDAAAINQAGGDEIAGGLRPENIPFVADARQVCSHVVDF